MKLRNQCLHSPYPRHKKQQRKGNPKAKIRRVLKIRYTVEEAAAFLATLGKRDQSYAYICYECSWIHVSSGQHPYKPQT